MLEAARLASCAVNAHWLKAIVVQRDRVDRTNIRVGDRAPGGAMSRVQTFEFERFEDLAGACEARAALASYREGDRALALSHANLAATLHAGWRPLVHLLTGRGS